MSVALERQADQRERGAHVQGAGCWSECHCVASDYYMQAVLVFGVTDRNEASGRANTADVARSCGTLGADNKERNRNEDRTMGSIGAAQAAASGAALVALLVGGALNYFGFRLHQIALFLAGGALGLVVGAGITGVFSGRVDPFLTVLVAVLFGFLAIVVQRAVVCGLGAAIGIGLAILAGGTDPILLSLAAIVCGAIALALYRFAIVVGTSFLGSGLMTYGVLVMLALSHENALRVVWNDPGTLAVQNLLIFAGLFVSGVLVQYHFSFAALSGTRADGRAGLDQRTAGAVHREPANQQQERPEPELEKGVRGDPPPYSGMRDIDPSEVFQAAGSPSRGAPKWFGILYPADGAPRRFAIDVEPVVVGRDANCRIAVDDELISREHLRLSRLEDCVLIEDMGSRNGTWHEGRQRVERAMAAHGDWFMVGDTRLLVQFE